MSNPNDPAYPIDKRVKERPILFSAPMVRAILDGRKTQTRRIVKPRRDLDFGCQLAPCEIAVETRNGNYGICPYGQPGDRLWVRETWGMTYTDLVPTGRPFTVGGTWGSPSRPGRPPCVVFKADGDMPDDSPHETARWSPSIHMPRWASRITLEVTGVRVERFRFHDIRAKSASDTQDIAAAAARLGHASPEITRRVYVRSPQKVRPLR